MQVVVAVAGVVVPDDLISEILVRLPAKSVGRFRCVSKQWLSLTSDPKFVHAHASLAPISGFIPHPNCYNGHIPLDGASDLDRLPDPFFPPRGEIMGGPPVSYHGLLLHHRVGKEDCKVTEAFYICNPMTKQLLVVIPCSLEMVFGHALWLDQCEPSRFKVAVWEYAAGRQADKCMLHVYSSLTRSWKVVYEIHVENAKEWCGRRAVSWNGSLAWRSLCSWFLLLDAEEEEVRKVPQPNLPCCYLGESRGRLHFIGEVDRMNTVDIFEMESESAGWSVLYHRLDLSWIRERYPDMPKPSVPSCVAFVRGDCMKEDELIFSLLMEHSPGEYSNKVISFLPRSKSCATVIERLPIRTVLGLTPHAHTLLSL